MSKRITLMEMQWPITCLGLHEIGYNSENERTKFKSETTYQITDLDYTSHTAGAQGNPFPQKV